MNINDLERRAEALQRAKEVARDYAFSDKAGINGTLQNEIADLILDAEERGRQVGYEAGYADGIKAAQDPTAQDPS